MIYNKLKQEKVIKVQKRIYNKYLNIYLNINKS